MIWHEIVDPQDIFLDDVFQLYDRIFPMEVREPHDVLMKSLETSQMDETQSFGFLVGLVQETVVSFATAHYFSGVNSGFIVYIGTDASYRKQGIGSLTMAKTEEWMQKKALRAGYESLRSIILEAEQMENMPTELEKVECMNRNRFFEKNGYHHASSVRYVQPPLHANESAVSLNLFVKTNQGYNLSKSELYDVIYSMYFKKYGLLNQIQEHILHDCLQFMGISGQKPRV